VLDTSEKRGVPSTFGKPNPRVGQTFGSGGPRSGQVAVRVGF
jgi:hypothetical protein